MLPRRCLGLLEKQSEPGSRSFAQGCVRVAKSTDDTETTGIGYGCGELRASSNVHTAKSSSDQEDNAAKNLTAHASMIGCLIPTEIPSTRCSLRLGRLTHKSR